VAYYYPEEFTPEKELGKVAQLAVASAHASAQAQQLETANKVAKLEIELETKKKALQQVQEGSKAGCLSYSSKNLGKSSSDW
jgi:hypothetical protein